MSHFAIDPAPGASRKLVMSMADWTAFAYQVSLQKAAFCLYHLGWSNTYVAEPANQACGFKYVVSTQL